MRRDLLEDVPAGSPAAVPDLEGLVAPAWIALRVSTSRAAAFALFLGITGFVGGIVADASAAESAAMGLLVALAVLWWIRMDIRFGTDWVAMRRWRRWNYVRLRELETLRATRPRSWFLSPMSYRNKAAWQVELRDEGGRRIKFPAGVLRHGPFRLVLLRAAEARRIPVPDLIRQPWPDPIMDRR